MDNTIQYNIQLLSSLNELIDTLSSSNSTNDKIDILNSVESEDIKKLFHYIYNPYFKYGVKWSNIKKRSDLFEEFNGSIFDLLNRLYKREITGHKAIGTIRGFMDTLGNDLLPMVEAIFDRSLKCRVDSKLINRVFPGLIPAFDVALATKYEDFAHRIDWGNEKWYWSRKLDGVRVIMRIENGNVRFYSRQGKEFYTLGKIENAIKNHPAIQHNLVFDGELCIVDENGNEDFQSVIKEIRRKEHTIENPIFKVFDCLTLEEFDKGSGSDEFTYRYNAAQFHFGSNIIKKDFPIMIVEHNEIESEDKVIELSDYATEIGWEGIMLRKDVSYKGKRSNDILKVKKFHDKEYVVKDIEYGPFRIIDKELKKEITIQTMTNVIIEHKGNIVSVGSGFSIEDRNHYYNNPSDIIGKEITVQYFEESTDKTGKHSLRFPVCKTVYETGIRQV